MPLPILPPLWVFSCLGRTQLLHCGTVLRRAVTLAACLGLSAAAAHTCPAGANRVEMQPVLPGIAVVHGRWPAQDANMPDHIATTVVISEGRTATVLDPGPTHRWGKALQQHLRCQHGQRVVRVINSHAHAENVLADGALSAPVSATAATRAAMQRRCPACLAALRHALGTDALRGTRITIPQQMLRNGQMLEAGGRRWQVLDMPDAHSESDLVLWSESQRIALAGPLVDNNRLVLAQGSVQGWLQAIDQIESLRPQWLIGQHRVAGPDEVGAALATQRQALCSLVRLAWQGLESGWSEAEGLQHWPVTATDSEADRRQQRFNLLRAWREMEGLWINHLPPPAACSAPDVGG